VQLHRSSGAVPLGSLEPFHEHFEVAFTWLAFYFYFPGYKVYARRWAVLILFVFYSSSNAMQWIQYTIINNIITR